MVEGCSPGRQIHERCCERWVPVFLVAYEQQLALGPLHRYPDAQSKKGKIHEVLGESNEAKILVWNGRRR